MMKLFILIICCIPVFTINYLQAQSYSSVHYDAKDGLPSATVYDITQDINGFIWFGTENGMCRFDGKNFRTYTTMDGLPDNAILKVHGDNQGRIYFAPFTHGLYYYQNDSFFKFPVPEAYKTDMSNVSSLANKGNDVMVSGFSEIYFIKDNNSMISLPDRYGKKLHDFQSSRVYNTMLVAKIGDSLFYFPDTGKAIGYPHKNSNDPRLVYDSSGRTVMLRFPLRPDFIIHDFLNDSLAYDYSDNTLHLFNIRTGALIHEIRIDKFSDALIDKENNLWISTLGDGIYRYPSFNFRQVKFDGKSEIYCVANFNHRLIVGTDRSRAYDVSLDDQVNSFAGMNFSAFDILSLNPIVRLYHRNRVYALCADENNLYIGTDGFLLKKTGPAAPVFSEIFRIKDIDIQYNDMLISTGHSALIADKRTLAVKDTLLVQRSTCGASYHSNYYIGTLGGLIKIDSATKQITELYTLFPSFKRRITAIKRGIHDDLWIATSGSGLVHFKNDKIILTLKQDDGLSSSICTSLFIDGNVVWLGTNNGLNRIEPGGEKPIITHFTSANGLGADFINAVFATDSDIYIGTTAGLTIFSKNALAETSVCVFHILDVSENNKRLKKDSVYSFPYNALNIKIDFTAISFKSAGDIIYSYRLQGLDKDWNTTTANFVNFPTLQPGDYTLFLKATNKFGVKSDTKSIRIIINPPWWQTLVFRIIMLSVIGLVVLMIYRYNIRNIRKKEEIKRDFETRFAALEQKALQAQMNPHFIFNSLNSIQTFILNLDVEGANAYLANFASLIRQTLENSMHPLITVSSEIKYLETYLTLEKLRFRDKFEYDIEVDEAVDQNNTLLPGMLLQPYIENSIRHGIQHRKDNNGLISLTITKTFDNSILYTITDNGVGRGKAEELRSSRHIEYQSRGTSINEKRIAAINKQFKTNIRVNTEDILDENGTVTGTTVTVFIPPLHK